jgi:hypothetical protein
METRFERMEDVRRREEEGVLFWKRLEEGN